VPYDCGFGLLVLVDSTPRCSVRTSRVYRTRLLRVTSSVLLFHVGFELRCVQLLPVSRGYPALRSHTTGTPVATKRSSSRTIRSFTSSTLTPQ